MYEDLEWANGRIRKRTDIFWSHLQVIVFIGKTSCLILTISKNNSITILPTREVFSHLIVCCILKYLKATVLFVRRTAVRLYLSKKYFKHFKEWEKYRIFWKSVGQNAIGIILWIYRNCWRFYNCVSKRNDWFNHMLVICITFEGHVFNFWFWKRH